MFLSLVQVGMAGEEGMLGDVEGLSPQCGAGYWYPSLEWHLKGPAGSTGWGRATQTGHFVPHNPLYAVLTGSPGVHGTWALLLLSTGK